MRPLAIVLLALGTAPVQAATTVQRLTAEPSLQVVTAGDLASVTLTYDSNDSTATGVGVHAYYNSSKVTLESAEILFDSQLTGAQDSPSGAELDGDPATDRRYLAAWTAIGGDWPGDNVVLPLALVELRFRTHDGYLSTDIQLTGAHCAQCTPELEGATIQVVGGGPTYTPTATPTATGTPTPFPTPTFGPSPTPGPIPPGGLPPSGYPPPPPPPNAPLTSVPRIPATSALGLLLLVVALAGSALMVLLRRRP